eukprot:TRINITY_DN12184_c0_g1_i1.p1 TRINITY_DN12184_c0_g1~~TRINITY_DN12184_c0_g1_i1.p1  ORF type:complete len:404 (-),score=56.32 TRINITY_DN12184_c0_g1_i1:317-1528(-)
MSFGISPWTPRVVEEVSAPTNAGPVVPGTGAVSSSIKDRGKSRKPETSKGDLLWRATTAACFTGVSEITDRRSSRPGSACPNPSPQLQRKRLDRLESSGIGFDDSFYSEQDLLNASLGDTADWTKWASPEEAQRSDKTQAAAAQAVPCTVHPPPRPSSMGEPLQCQVGSITELCLGGQSLHTLSRPSSRTSTDFQCSRGVCRPRLSGLQRALSKPRGSMRSLPSGPASFRNRRANSSPPAPSPPALVTAGLPPPPDGARQTPPLICSQIGQADAVTVSAAATAAATRPSSAVAASAADRKTAASGGKPLSWANFIPASGGPMKVVQSNSFGVLGSGGSGAPAELGCLDGQGAPSRSARSRSATARPVAGGLVGKGIGLPPSGAVMRRPLTGSTARRTKAAESG